MFCFCKRQAIDRFTHACDRRYYSAAQPEVQILQSRRAQFDPKNFRPSQVKLAEIVGVQWSAMNQLKAKTKALFEAEETFDAYASLGKYVTEEPPSTAALKALGRIIDIRDIVMEEDAARGAGGGGQKVADSGTKRPNRMPPHIWKKQQDRRRREQEKQAAKAAREEQVLQQKQALIDGLIEQTRSSVTAQAAAATREARENMSRKLEELKIQRQQLVAQRKAFEEQQAREKMLIREDMIMCPITQEVCARPRNLLSRSPAVCLLYNPSMLTHA